MKKLVHVRGATCSGKSTTVFEYMKAHGITERCIYQPERFKYTRGEREVVLGWYKEETSTKGGCDAYCLNGAQLKRVIKHFMTEDIDAIIFEGQLYGKTFSLAMELKALAESAGWEYVPISLEIPYVELIERMLGRNGGQLKNEHNHYDSYRSAVQSTTNLIKAGVPVKVVDTSKIRQEDMHTIIESVL